MPTISASAHAKTAFLRMSAATRPRRLQAFTLWAGQWQSVKISPSRAPRFTFLATPHFHSEVGILISVFLFDGP